nr:hypothetical protein [Tanacetum cinerariifolium]
EPEFNEKKPKSKVNVSPSSSAQSKKQDDKTKREAKGKSYVDSSVRKIFPNNTNTFSAAGPSNAAAGPSNAAASPTHGKSSFIDASQLPDDPDMPELEDITYSDDEDDVELARMGYEKPSTKLTFYKAFFSSQCRKFNFSKYIFDSLVRNVDSPLKFYMYPYFLQLIIKKQVGNLSTYTTKYTSPALTQKVFANIQRVGKGFSGVDTPLFEGMLVEQQVVEEGDADENDENVNAGDTTEGDVSAAHDEVPTVAKEPSIPSLTPPTPPPQPSHDIPSTSQDARIPIKLFQELMDTYTDLIRRVKHLELDKVAQAMEITKLKQRVKKLERRNKVRVLKLRRLQKVGTTQRVETSDEAVMDDVSNQGRMIAEMDQDADVVLEDDKEVVDAVKDVQDDIDKSAQDQGRKAESKAEIYKIDLEHANKVLSMQEDESKPTKVQEVVEVVTTAKIITEVVTAASETITAASITITATEAQVPATILTAAPARVIAAPSRRRKGVVIRDPQEESTTSIIILAETKSKDKEAELNKNIDWDEVIDHVKKKAKEDPAVKKYQALKRKPQTEAQARKNMMLYLKNVDGFKMDYFKGMSYDDICPIFKEKFNTNMAFLLKTKEHIKEEESRALKRLNETLAEKEAKRQKLDEEVEELKRHLQIVPNKDDDVYTKATSLARKVPVVDYEIIEQNNKPYYKIIRADDTYQLYVSFLSLLRNFDREDLEALWSLVKKRFSTTKPKNYSDDFLLITLRSMFEKLNIHAQIWKNQRSVHERKYPLIRFTLDQMLNAVRLEVKEESKVSLELLRFIQQQHQEGQLE